MFTGIVQATGVIRELEPRDGDLHLGIDCEGLDLSGVELGDSISVDGCCLTAVALSGHGFAADVSNETLALTTLGQRALGDAVNLELALRHGDRLGGHLVSGHVDGIGELATRADDARSTRMRFSMPPAIARFVALKGSVTVDGVSLTVNAVTDDAFEVNLVPHTLEVTTLGGFQPGRAVNLEVDLIARYLDRLLGAEGDADRAAAMDALIKAGIISE
jgi:riboflavin synthase